MMVKWKWNQFFQLHGRTISMSHPVGSDITQIIHQYATKASHNARVTQTNQKLFKWFARRGLLMRQTKATDQIVALVTLPIL